MASGTGMEHEPNLAREVNAHILALEARLHDVGAHMRVPELDLIGLFCECGCMGEVAMTREDYEAAGAAWLEGHDPLSNGR